MKSMVEVVQYLLKPYIDSQIQTLSTALTNKADKTVVSTTADGLAPQVTDTSKFLKGDGTWANDELYKQWLPIFGKSSGRGLIADATNVNTDKANGINNRVGYVAAGSTINMPSEISEGIREVIYYSSSNVMVKITGKDTNGLYGEWSRLYNGSSWTKWVRTAKNRNWNLLGTFNDTISHSIDLTTYTECMALVLHYDGTNRRALSFYLPVGVNTGNFLEANPYFYAGSYFTSQSHTSAQIQYNGSSIKMIQLEINGTTYTSGFEFRVYAR